jgi:hypothetical protein
MISMFSTVWPAMPKRVINTHEDADHVWATSSSRARKSLPIVRYRRE